MISGQGFDSLDLTPAEPWVDPASPKFTIITACKNNSRTIEECVASVAEQSIGGVEHVIVDCQSSDDSLERIHPHRERLSIVYGRAEDTRFQAWNRGIGHASGNVVGFVDGADVLANPDVLRRVSQALQDPWVSAAYGDILRVEANDTRQVKRHHHVGPSSSKKLSRGWVPPTTALFVRRTWYRRIDGFSTQLRTVADYDASLRLFAHPFFKATYIGAPVVRQRLVEPNLQQLRDLLNTPREELRALRSAKIGGCRALAWHWLRKLGQWL